MFGSSVEVESVDPVRTDGRAIGLPWLIIQDPLIPEQGAKEVLGARRKVPGQHAVARAAEPLAACFDGHPGSLNRDFSHGLLRCHAARVPTGLSAEPKLVPALAVLDIPLGVLVDRFLAKIVENSPPFRRIDRVRAATFVTEQRTVGALVHSEHVTK